MNGFACSRWKPSGWGRFTGGPGAMDPPVRKSGNRPARRAPETLPHAVPVTPYSPSAGRDPPRQTLSHAAPAQPCSLSFGRARRTARAGAFPRPGAPRAEPRRPPPPPRPRRRPLRALRICRPRGAESRKLPKNADICHMAYIKLAHMLYIIYMRRAAMFR